MEFPWYSNISWYGNLLELLGGFFGVLQYVGVGKINQIIMRFNIWKKDNFVTIGIIKFPVDQSLVALRDEVQRIQKFLAEIIKKYWKSNLTLAITLLGFIWGIVEILIYLDVPISGKSMLSFMGAVVVFIALPLVIYSLIAVLFAIFIVVSALVQAIVYFALFPILFILKYTSKYREQLIIASVFVVLIGLSLQVIGPIVQTDKFINSFNNFTR